MIYPIIRQGTLYAPCFIFIQCADRYTDAELLHQLGISGFQRDIAPTGAGDYLFVTEDAHWMHVADDWLYTLWRIPGVWARVAALAAHHAIFTCSVGDADPSFDFAYYHAGHLVRRYVVDHTMTIVDNRGVPLPTEAAAMQHTDALRGVLTLATSLGIDIHHDPATIRTYAKRG